MLGFAVVECGLSESTFWRLTPAKLTAIVRQRQEHIKREDYRAGIIAMLIRAACGEKKTHPFDFFPHHKDAPAQTPSDITGADEVRKSFRAYIEATEKHGR